MAILYGTQSNGETLPVLVDQFGNLLAKGIEGEPGTPGAPGEPGEPGGAFPLPPGATDGALLGWQDGELVWVTEPVPLPVPGCVPLIYTGNGSTQTISGLNFSPGLVWIKDRGDANFHVLVDSVRGTGSNGSLFELYSNATYAEGNIANRVTGLTSTGFTLGSDSNKGVNNSGASHVAWCWDAGSSTVTNNDGTIQSQVRANASAGFSVVTFTMSSSGTATVGHGLGVAPSLIIAKSSSLDSSNWNVFHSGVCTKDNFFYLNTTSALGTFSDIWGTAVPTSSVFGVNINLISASQDIVAYCWAETPGVSSFSQYSGNGSRQTISTGFRPSLVIIKSTGTGNWFMFDNARGAANTLYANLAEGEGETGVVEFLDNGFQLLFGLPGVNQSNQTYIYAAFANPSDAAFAQRQLRREARQLERQQNETRPR